MRVYQYEKVGKKVGENRGKFYLSPNNVFAAFFVPFTHNNVSLPTRVCQLNFAVWIEEYIKVVSFPESRSCENVAIIVQSEVIPIFTRTDSH